MTWQKKYRWTRTLGDETGWEREPHEDYVGWDGDVQIGRIYLDQQTLKAGRWRWAIQYPKGGMPCQPNSGWEATASEAAKVVEESWDEQMQKVALPLDDAVEPPAATGDIAHSSTTYQGG